MTVLRSSDDGALDGALRTERRLRAALDELPGNYLDIAEHLHLLRITGRRHRCAECPLSEYLTARLGTEVLVTAATAEVSCARFHVSVRLRDHERAFVAAFDRGMLFDWLLGVPGTGDTRPMHYDGAEVTS